MAKTLIGNIKGPQGPKGDRGPQGEQGIQGPEGPIGLTGDNGQRGSRWVTGRAITGTSTTDTVFSETGISDSIVNDHYLNDETGNIYRCTLAGPANIATWVYEGNIKPNNISIDTGISGWNSISGNKTINKMAYGNGMFVGVDSSDSKTMYYSEDGITWSKSNLSTTYRVDIILYGNGKFICYEYNTGELSCDIHYSEDGITWTDGACLFNTYIASMTCGVYGNGKFILSGYKIADDKIPVMIYSEDGITWSECDGLPDKTTASLGFDVLFSANGKFWAYDESGCDYYSEDGISWTVMDDAAVTPSAVIYAKGIYVGYAKEYLIYSNDGITWTNSLNVPNIIYTDFDPSTGRPLPKKKNRYLPTIYVDGIFIAGAYYSKNGIEWKQWYYDNDGYIDTVLGYRNIYGDNGIVNVNGKYMTLDNKSKTLISLEFVKEDMNLEEVINSLYKLLW